MLLAFWPFVGECHLGFIVAGWQPFAGDAYQKRGVLITPTGSESPSCPCKRRRHKDGYPGKSLGLANSINATSEDCYARTDRIASSNSSGVQTLRAPNANRSKK